MCRSIARLSNALRPPTGSGRICIWPAKSVEIAEKDRKVAQSDYYPQVEAYYNINQQGNTPDLQRKETTAHAVPPGKWAHGPHGMFFSGEQHTMRTKAPAGSLPGCAMKKKKLKLDVGYDIKSRLLSLREAESG